MCPLDQIDEALWTKLNLEYLYLLTFAKVGSAIIHGQGLGSRKTLMSNRSFNAVNIVKKNSYTAWTAIRMKGIHQKYQTKPVKSSLGELKSCHWMKKSGLLMDLMYY